MSFGGVQYIFDVGYGVGKVGFDCFIMDMVVEFKLYNVYVVMLYFGVGVIEVTVFFGGEIFVFMGRVVVVFFNKVMNED